MFWTWFIALALSQAVFNSQLKKAVRIFLILLVRAASMWRLSKPTTGNRGGYRR